MLLDDVISVHFSRKYCFLLILLSLIGFTSCGGKKPVLFDDSTADGTNKEEDFEEMEDTLVYDLPETAIPETVDESFLDFLYTFLHRRSFQLERVAYPVMVVNEDGEILETLRNGKSVNAELQFDSFEYLVMLIGEDQDPYDYLDQVADHAEVKQVNLHSVSCRTFVFDLRDEGWMFTGIRHENVGRDESFVRFYNHFVTDSIYRDEHLAQEIFVSLPSSDDDMEMIDGNIDSGQWDVFAPELPKDHLLLLDLGTHVNTSSGVKFVKCSVASSMLEVLTFEKEANDWKLIRYEE